MNSNDPSIDTAMLKYKVLNERLKSMTFFDMYEYHPKLNTLKLKSAYSNT